MQGVIHQHLHAAMAVSAATSCDALHTGHTKGEGGDGFSVAALC